MHNLQVLSLELNKNQLVMMKTHLWLVKDLGLSHDNDSSFITVLIY